MMRHFFGLMVMLVLGGCARGIPTDPGSGAGTGRVLQRVAGDAQTGAVGAELPQPLVVRVTRALDAAPEAAIPVTFTVTGGGSVSNVTVPTDGSGQAQVRWTLGPLAGTSGQRVQATLAGATGSPVTFSVVATPGAAAVIVVDSLSNNQRSAPGLALPAPVTVTTRDAFGNTVSGTPISWVVTQGGGSSSSSGSATDLNGRASTTWTLGASGTQQLQARATGLASATISASIVDLVITSVSADTLVPGQRVTLSGRGFGTSTATTEVRIGGVRAPIVSLTATSLVFDVPAACRPAGSVDIRLVAEGATAAPVLRPFRPAPSAAFAPGALVLLRDAAQFCLQFPATQADEAYVVGVLNSAESSLDLRSVSLNARTATPGTATRGWDVPAFPAAPRPLRAAAGALEPAVLPQSRRMLRHAAAEQLLRRRDAAAGRGHGMPRALMRTTGSAAPFLAATQTMIPPVAAVGDTIPIRYGFGGCTIAATIRTVVRQIGRRGLWLEDVENPAGGFTAQDYQQLSNTFDQQIFAVDSANWGNPTDLDNNGRTAIVVTRRVNDEGGVLGFVTAADFFEPSGANGCPRSNFGEVYYAIAPDPNNVNAALRYTRAEALADAPLLIAHEFTHIIQFGRRIGAQQPTLELWEAEGGATLSEQLNGFAAEQLAPTGNYGLGQAFTAFDPSRIAWYADTFTDLAQFYGFVCRQRDSSGSCITFGKVPGAPQACAIFATFATPDYSAMGAPCIGGRTAYGTPSLLFRYVADQYGPTYVGGPTRLLADLVSSGAVGLGNVTSRIGVPTDQLLAQFYATLYLDDRAAGLDPRIGMSTWNLTQIFEGSTTAADGSTRTLRPEARLLPLQRGFADFTESATVRGGSSSYLLLEGAARPGVALQVAGPDGITPPLGPLRVWVVRIR